MNKSDPQVSCTVEEYPDPRNTMPDGSPIMEAALIVHVDYGDEVISQFIIFPESAGAVRRALESWEEEYAGSPDPE